MHRQQQPVEDHNDGDGHDGGDGGDDGGDDDVDDDDDDDGDYTRVEIFPASEQSSDAVSACEHVSLLVRGLQSVLVLEYGSLRIAEQSRARWIQGVLLILSWEARLPKLSRHQ